jgi:putative transposase
MDQFESLNHTKWDCKYHVVFIPKYRRRTLYGDLKRHLGPVFRQLAEQRESRVEEGHLMPDHVHMLLSIPPKYAVSQVVGYRAGLGCLNSFPRMISGVPPGLVVRNRRWSVAT